MSNNILDTNAQQLWERIQAFQMDEKEVALPFSKRLARENGWSKHYTFKAIEEYKRFIFLVCIAAKPITPSAVVDAVWHLHLLYTKSYWTQFCGQTLQKSIHHNPTKGGSDEGQKFMQNYETTLSLYRSYFGENPPTDIWQPTQKRLIIRRLQWVDLSQYWLLPKSFEAVWRVFKNKIFSVASTYLVMRLIQL